MKVGLLAAIGCLSTSICLADPIRVSTWVFKVTGSVAPSAEASVTNDVLELGNAAAALKKSNPDVILVQGAVDWRGCQQLAQALKPDQYHVLGCSSFSSPRTNANSSPQVAILSK